jgi:hypothetical protein
MDFPWKVIESLTLETFPKKIVLGVFGHRELSFCVKGQKLPSFDGEGK